MSGRVSGRGKRPSDRLDKERVTIIVEVQMCHGDLPPHLDELGGGAGIIGTVGQDEGQGLGVEGHAAAHRHEDVVGVFVRRAEGKGRVVEPRNVRRGQDAEDPGTG